jgi:hypothetical protein
LGQHFRSEPGLVFVKPLLDEEAAERRKAWLEEQEQMRVAATSSSMQSHHIAPLPIIIPAALLRQYPALAGLDLNALSQAPAPPALDREAYFTDMAR